LKQGPDRVIHELHPLAFAGHNHVLKFCVAPSRMIAETAAFAIRISLTAIRPVPSCLFQEQLSEHAA